MAIKISTTYSGRTDNTDPNYPWGKGRNVVGGVEGTGTPFEADWYNNLEGFLQGLLLEADITPDGNVDNANSSQLVEAVKGLEKSADKVIMSDSSTLQTSFDDLNTSFENLDASGINLSVSGSVQDAVTYATPDMYGYTSLTELQDAEEVVLENYNFNVYSSLGLMNSRGSPNSLAELSNFSGQTDYGNEPSGFIFNHFTDGDVLNIVNVGEDNSIINLTNGNSPSNRTDKASNFTGQGDFLSFNYYDTVTLSVKNIITWDQDGGLVWSGEKGTAVLIQGKTDDSTASFKVNNSNSHEKVLEIVNGDDKTAAFTISNEEIFTKYLIKTDNTQTAGLGFEAGVGDIWLTTNDPSLDSRIKINKPLQHTADNTEITAETGKVVNITVPLLNSGYNFEDLPDPTLYAGSNIHIVDRGYKPSYSNGTNWLFFSDDSVVV